MEPKKEPGLVVKPEAGDTSTSERKIAEPEDFLTTSLR
jgi:hypothetical protein